MQNLTFEKHNFELIERNGRVWLRAADIAQALGYKRSDKVNQVFDRHKDEFTESMTLILENLTLGHGNLTSEVRVFSLRGAHLIGMFARTANGMKFRKWILDQLEILEQHITSSKSLMVEWFEAKAELDDQVRFASYCGRGLNHHKSKKPPLEDRVKKLKSQLQPSLLVD